MYVCGGCTVQHARSYLPLAVVLHSGLSSSLSPPLLFSVAVDVVVVPSLSLHGASPSQSRPFSRPLGYDGNTSLVLTNDLLLNITERRTLSVKQPLTPL